MGVHHLIALVLGPQFPRQSNGAQSGTCSECCWGRSHEGIYVKHSQQGGLEAWHKRESLFSLISRLKGILCAVVTVLAGLRLGLARSPAARGGGRGRGGDGCCPVPREDTGTGRSIQAQEALASESHLALQRSGPAAKSLMKRAAMWLPRRSQGSPRDEPGAA